MKWFKSKNKNKVDIALSNGTIKENDIVLIKDKDNFEGIIVKETEGSMEFPTVPSCGVEDSGKILGVNDNGIPEWKEVDKTGEAVTVTVSVDLTDLSTITWTAHNQIFLVNKTSGSTSCTLKIEPPLGLTSAGQGISCRVLFNIISITDIETLSEDNRKDSIPNTTYTIKLDASSTGLEDPIKVLTFENLILGLAYIVDISIFRVRGENMSEDDEDLLMCFASCNPAV